MNQQHPVWPIPQEMMLRGDALPLGNAVLVVPAQATESDLAPAQLLADMLADDFTLDVPIVRGAAPQGKAAISVKIAGRPGAGRAPRELPGAEGYLLKVTAQGAEILGRDHRGAEYAAATLLQLCERRGRDIVVRGAEVRDWPYKPIRMVHLYVPGQDHLGYARRYLRDFLVRYKFNGVFVELAGGVRLRRRPRVATGWRRFVDEMRGMGDTKRLYDEQCPLGPGATFQNSIHTHLADGRYLEPDELSQLFTWAREYLLDPVPEVQSLSHSYYLASTFREIAELPEAEYPESYCPLNPRSYEILFDVLSEVLALTKCRSVHIGHDEWYSGGQCPRCRERDAGELFAGDVIRIASWLGERGLGAWMWADQLLPAAAGSGGRSQGEKVLYRWPETLSAGKLIAERGLDITVLNWYWSAGASDQDNVLRDLGFKQIYGNLYGQKFEGWQERSAEPSVFGGETSSWCAWEDYELGLAHYPSALYSANLLWSTHWPGVEAQEAVAQQLPKLRDRMRRRWEKPRLWSEAVAEKRKRVLSIREACNASLKTEEWDLSGLSLGRQESAGIPYEIIDPNASGGPAAVVVERLHRPADRYPHASQPLPIGGKYASLIFWQVASGTGGYLRDAGEKSNTPREAAELLSWYELRYADGLTRTAEVRFGLNLLEWNYGFEARYDAPLYHAREIRAGVLPDGRPAVIWGFEWTNPRPEIVIESMVVRGARAMPETYGPSYTSDARPILLGITGVESPRWEDYRPGRALPVYGP